MPARLDHVAVGSDNPREVASFYERLLGARVVTTAGHPVMAYLGSTAFAFHDRAAAPEHVGLRVSDRERAALRERLEAEGVECWERDHGVAVGLFFRDPEGRLLEAITYRAGS